jgi:16S rRNA (guanine527-N7)-methyltransferase
VTSEAFEVLQRVAGPVSRETFERLLSFEAQFRRWAQRINLVAPSTLDDAWNRHVLDSAQLARLDSEAKNWVDLGSGGGFPGLVMGFLLMERKGANIDLVESNRKKTSFLQAIVGEFGLPARIHAKRIEDTYDKICDVEVVTARALAPLGVLLGLAEPWLTSGAKALFHKGRDYRSEIEESAKLWVFDLIEHQSVVDPQSVVLEIRNLRRV